MFLLTFPAKSILFLQPHVSLFLLFAKLIILDKKKTNLFIYQIYFCLYFTIAHYEDLRGSCGSRTIALLDFY